MRQEFYLKKKKKKKKKNKKALKRKKNPILATGIFQNHTTPPATLPPVRRGEKSGLTGAPNPTPKSTINELGQKKKKKKKQKEKIPQFFNWDIKNCIYSSNFALINCHKLKKKKKKKEKEKVRQQKTKGAKRH